MKPLLIPLLTAFLCGVCFTLFFTLSGVLQLLSGIAAVVLLVLSWGAQIALAEAVVETTLDQVEETVERKIKDRVASIQ